MTVTEQIKALQKIEQGFRKEAARSKTLEASNMAMDINCDAYIYKEEPYLTKVCCWDSKGLFLQILSLDNYCSDAELSLINLNEPIEGADDV